MLIIVFCLFCHSYLFCVPWLYFTRLNSHWLVVFDYHVIFLPRTHHVVYVLHYIILLFLPLSFSSPHTAQSGGPIRTQTEAFSRPWNLSPNRPTFKAHNSLCRGLDRSFLANAWLVISFVSHATRKAQKKATFWPGVNDSQVGKGPSPTGNLLLFPCILPMHYASTA